MVLQNYQKFIEMTSNMIYIVALGVGFKCPHKIHLNTLCPPLAPMAPSFPAPLVGTIADQSQSQSLFEIDKDKACLQVSLGTFQT